MTAGRPPLADGEARPCSVYLTAAQIATARRLGDGNLSEGVRRALTARQKFPIDSTAQPGVRYRL